MNKTPVVSIITPLFNSERYIKETINSVLDQTFGDWELILIDDCSTDRTSAEVKPFMSNPKIMYLRLEENSGAAVARNTGIGLARGRFIAFLDSDDFWDANKLKLQLDFMLHNNYEFTYSNYERVSDKGDVSKGVISPPDTLTYKELLKSNRIGCLTVIYDTKALGKVKMPLLRKRQDYALWLRLLKVCDKAYKVDGNLAYYRMREGSISSNKFEMLRFNWKVFRKSEKFGFFKSCYYLFQNIVEKIRLESRTRANS